MHVPGLNDDELAAALRLSRLSRLSEPRLRALLDRGRAVEVPPGKHAREPGAPARVCFIVSGLLRVMVPG